MIKLNDFFYHLKIETELATLRNLRRTTSSESAKKIITTTINRLTRIKTPNLIKVLIRKMNLISRGKNSRLAIEISRLYSEYGFKVEWALMYALAISFPDTNLFAKKWDDNRDKIWDELEENEKTLVVQIFFLVHGFGSNSLTIKHLESNGIFEIESPLFKQTYGQYASLIWIHSQNINDSHLIFPNWFPKYR